MYASFFSTRRLQKDLDTLYNPDSSKVAAHQNVYNNFKTAEADNLRGGSGLVYGEFQVVQLPEKCKGLVKQSFAGYAPSPFRIPSEVTEMVNGMEVRGEQHSWHNMQFVLYMTFRVMTDHQFAKEKKAVRATVQSYDILEEIDSEDDVDDL